MRKVIFLLTLGFYFIISVSFSFADGLIVIKPPPHPIPRPIPINSPYHAPFVLEVVSHRVNVSIDRKNAVTNIEQSFYNPTNYRLEGYYLFPIPEGAVIKDFSMTIDGKNVHAELLNSKKARKLYEDIVRKIRDPALLEYSNQGLFKVRIFPFQAHSSKKVFISYREILNEDFTTISYTYPLNTEKFSAKPLKNVSIDVVIKGNDELKNIYCPTHKIDIVRNGNSKAHISYEENNLKPDKDFKLYFSHSPSKIGISFLTYKENNEDGFYYLSLNPSFSTNNKDIGNKNIIFILDVSGSMAGEKLEHAKQALIYCVENLKNEDGFDIIKFSTEARSLFKKIVKVNNSNRLKARNFIKHLRPVGGTNIEEAIQSALNEIRPDNRTNMIIFITDGKPTIGETQEDKLISKIKLAGGDKTRIFTFGIGTEINTHLLDKITKLSKASRTYIAPSEDIEIKISDFFNRVQSPVLSNIKLSFGKKVDVFQYYPSSFFDLFKGSNLTIFGRYSGHGKTKLTLQGDVNGKQRKLIYNVNFSSYNVNNDFIPSIWAARRIGYLLDIIRLHGESKEIVDEVTLLARNYGIITPYTSYLIIEDEKKRTVYNELPEYLQTFSNTEIANNNVGRRFKKEYKTMQLKDSSAAIQVSKDFQSLYETVNAPQKTVGKKRLFYKNKKGISKNLADQVKSVSGHALYQNGDFWVDSQLQQKKILKKIRIKFASSEYFSLIKNQPKVTKFLAMSRNIRFYFKGIFYEIFE